MENAAKLVVGNGVSLSWDCKRLVLVFKFSDVLMWLFSGNCVLHSVLLLVL